MTRLRVAVLMLALAGAVWGGAGPASAEAPDRAAATARAALAPHPDDAAAWVVLAEAQRVMGYQAEARASLERAAAIINELPAGEREPLAGPYSTTKAWLEYDATNWRAAAD